MGTRVAGQRFTNEHVVVCCKGFDWSQNCYKRPATTCHICRNKPSADLSVHISTLMCVRPTALTDPHRPSRSSGKKSTTGGSVTPCSATGGGFNCFRCFFLGPTIIATKGCLLPNCLAPRVPILAPLASPGRSLKRHGLQEGFLPSLRG